MANKFFLPLAILLASLSVAPVGAQRMSEGESFLGEVREQKVAEVMARLEAPGSRIVNFKGYAGEAAIHIITREKRPRWLATFLLHGADPDLQDKDGQTALLIATELQDMAMVGMLLERDADPNLADRSGQTPLMVAVRLRNPRLIEALMLAGADPDRTDVSAGLSARDYAARDNRNPELLALIEEIEAKEAAKTEEGELTFGPILR